MLEINDFHWQHKDGVAALVRPGIGGTVVIVPGAMADAQSWLPVGASFNTPLSVAIVNRRGRAPSSDMPIHSSVANEVFDLLTLMSTMSGPYVMVGWSYGGLLAMEAAISDAAIDSIILYEPVSSPFAPAAIESIRHAVDANDLDRAVELVITKVSGAPAEYVANLRQSPAWAYLKPLAIPAATELAALNQHQPDFSAYRAIDVPTTILVGSLNEGREPYGQAARRFVDALPKAASISLNGQGHLAHIEAPLQLAEAINAVLRDNLPFGKSAD